ncbi:mediator of RNA polymerase II transcription subunit 15a-like isoform X2 [Prosopis cineraria]|uniref:mediator of RNA polymerase II transcription subunit 15a-like isoform X2 n=1 Tax=Prosopis cineraria TaxID=364024 RepID=UPI00240FFCFB|nr:mediator of RNA polymerase II transcription subunit 15a-like isoform X2 [Prosopis cineraria]
MDTNWGPTQGTEPSMDTSDWRAQLQPDARQRIVNKIMDTLKRHLPVSGQEGLLELRKIAQRFEEKIYTAATSQPDYLRKISLKMLTMENKTQSTLVNPVQSKTGGPSNKPIDSVHNPGQSHAISLPNQSQSRQQLLPQNMQNNIAPPASNIGQTPIQNVVGPNSNMQSNMFSGSQRQTPPRQQVVPQQQQQSQNSQQYMYQQQQLQQQYLKHKLQPGNIQHPLMQPHIQQQQQQQPNLQPNQLQSSQPSVMQTSLSSLQQNQQSNNVQQSTQPMLQQHSQSVIRQQQQQTSVINQQQTPITQQPVLPPQQQQQLLAQQSNVTSMQHPQLLGQQNNVGDMQQHQRFLVGQQNNLPNLQQQQLINQQNNLSNMHQQQLGSNVPGLQQQQLLATQSGNSGMQISQHSAHMLQQSKVPMQQQSQQNVTNLLQSQGKQSQPQAPQQQLMPQIQSQPAQLQQQLGLQQQPNPLQRDMQQRLQASNSLLQQQNVLDHQKQLYQSQRTLPDSSSNSTAQTGKSSGDDWQEEVYQRIKSMKDLYLPELNEMYNKIASRLQQHESLPQQPKSEQLEKLKIFKTMLQRLIQFLQVPKDNIVPSLKDKMASYEKQIINFINTNKPRKPMSSGQLPPSHTHSVSQQQSQLHQVQPHENQMNSQIQSTNLQSSVPTMPQNNMASLQHNSSPALSGASTIQQNMIKSVQPGANLDSSSVNSLQQVAASSLHPNTLNAPQQTNINSLSSQGGGSVLQQNLNPLQPGSSMLQHQQLKQPQEQQMLQKHIQQRQLLQRQQVMQQQQQQQLQQVTKQQVPAHMQTHQIPPLHQISDITDVKMKQGLGVKPVAFQQHPPSGQRSAYPHQQFKPGGPYPVSSPHILQPASPQSQQHPSPQVDQQNLSSFTKASTPLQSANSTFVGPTPSPPLAPSLMPDSEKPISVVSSVSNAANIGHQQTRIATVPAQSLAIGTPGISPSPLLEEFSGADGAHGNALAPSSAKLTVAEQPIECLIKAVKSMSPKALSAAVSDIGSVVSMIDRIAGSAPGNGSRAAVGEDLVAMTKCRLQTRNFINQDGTNGTKRTRRFVSAMPLNVVSSPDCMDNNMKQLNALEVADLDSATTASIKKPRIKANHSLLEEIREINQRLIDTVVDISDEDVDHTAAAAAAEESEGTIVKCSFNAVALSSSLKSQYASAQMSPIQPLRLLVPTNYPNCSPILLDKFPVESSKENEDLSVKTKSRFSNSLRCLQEPMSLGEIARTWDVCARAIISEYAQQSGGGSFSSKYGTWENCLSAA